jgi:putative membrane protein
VTGERITPRFEYENQPSARLEPEAVPDVAEPRAGVGSVSLVLGGGVVLLLGLAVLDVANFVGDQFQRAEWLGWLTVAVALLGFALIAMAVWRELRGLIGLRRVDRLRRRLANPATMRQAAHAWLATLPEGQSVLPAIDAANDPDAILALLRAGPGETLRLKSQALGRVAAGQVLAAASVMPSPGLDGLLVAWRGTRLVRQVAALHGLRPGLLGTLALLRRVATSAATVAATDLAVDATMRMLLTGPLAQLAGDMAAAGVAARRMVVLARVTDAACSPLTPP